MNEYIDFIDQKRVTLPPSGFSIGKESLNANLFDFQKDIVRWALSRGRAAIFAGTGLGKTRMQVEWGWNIHQQTGGDVLFLAPLAVASQTVREAAILGYEMHLCRDQADVKPGLNITNYEMLHHFEPLLFMGVVLDESSILKSFTSKTRNDIIESFDCTPYRLACTATPAPNDYMEIGNHSEFLGVMGRTEMLAMYFVHDGGRTSQWRLKGHAEAAFWQWVASWGVVLEKPSDLGYSDDGYDLPPLNVEDVIVEVEGELASTLSERQKARRETVHDRTKAALGIVQKSQLYDVWYKPTELGKSSFGWEPKLVRESLSYDHAIEWIWFEHADEPSPDRADYWNYVKVPSGRSPDSESKIGREKWLIWCDLNAEQDALEALFGSDCVSIRGDTPLKERIKLEQEWREGDVPVLITKPLIFGWGLNWQHCPNMIFVGLSDSFEQVFQAIRRCYRFGQIRPVNVHMITSSREGATAENIKRKETDFQNMVAEMVKHTQAILSETIRAAERDVTEYKATKPIIIPSWLRSESVAS